MACSFCSDKLLKGKTLLKLEMSSPYYMVKRLDTRRNHVILEKAERGIRDDGSGSA